MRKLYVKKTSRAELERHWGFCHYLHGELYIRCNSEGEVKWEQAPVYKASELIVKTNVKILK